MPPTATAVVKSFRPSGSPPVGSHPADSRPAVPRPPRGRDGARPPRARGNPPAQDDQEILFQKFFKSVGPRTYAAQVKRARNGNHFLVLTEGKRDEGTGEVRKTRLFVYSEDFVEFFRLVKPAAEFIRANPLPADVRAKRDKFWARHGAMAGGAGHAASPVLKPAAGATPARGTTATLSAMPRADAGGAPARAMGATVVATPKPGAGGGPARGTAASVMATSARGAGGTSVHGAGGTATPKPRGPAA